MAVVRGAKKTTKKTPIPTAKIDVVLPSKKSIPSSSLGDFSWLIYGDKKIGKTSLCAAFDDALLYAFEPGAKALEIYQVNIPSWETAIAYNRELMNTTHKFRNVIVDTGKIAYDRNMQYVCKVEGMNHPSDLGYGKGWAAVAKSFEKFHLDILNNNLGLVVICHEKITEMELPSGLKQMRVEPDLSGSSMNFYHGMVDTIARYHYVGGERFLTVRGNSDYVAGTRLTNNFLTPEGEPIFMVPMGNSAEEAHRNLILAFNNNQDKTYKDYKGKESEGRAKSLKKKKSTIKRRVK